MCFGKGIAISLPMIRLKQRIFLTHLGALHSSEVIILRGIAVTRYTQAASTEQARFGRSTYALKSKLRLN